MELEKYLNSGVTDSSSQLTGHGDYLKGDHIRQRMEGDRHTALGRQGQKERDKRPGRSYIRDHCTCDLRSALVLLLFADAAHCPHVP